MLSARRPLAVTTTRCATSPHPPAAGSPRRSLAGSPRSTRSPQRLWRRKSSNLADKRPRRRSAVEGLALAQRHGGIGGIGGSGGNGGNGSSENATVHDGDASNGSSSSEPEQSPPSLPLPSPPLVMDIIEDAVTIPKAEAEHVFLEALEVVRARLPEGHADIARGMTSE